MRVLIALLDRALTETKADDWIDQVRWLFDWNKDFTGSSYGFVVCQSWHWGLSQLIANSL
jgi:hypothetical protein